MLRAKDEYYFPARPLYEKLTLELEEVYEPNLSKEHQLLSMVLLKGPLSVERDVVMEDFSMGL